MDIAFCGTWRLTMTFSAPERETKRELTIHDLEALKKTIVGNYFSIDPSGEGVFLHDILTGEPLTTGVPEAIMRTPHLRNGIRYLKHAGKEGRIAIDLVLGSHSEAADFCRMVDQHGQILVEPTVIALEMSSNVGGALVVSGASGRNDFQVEQLHWAAKNKKTILPCELQIDDDSPLSTRLTETWNKVVEPTISDTLQDRAINHATIAIVERSYQAVRQWAILARLGNNLEASEGKGLLAQDSQTRVPLILGAWHEPDQERLSLLGVPCAVHHTPLSERDAKYRDYGELVMAATLFGYAPMRFLRTPVPYAK